MDADIGEHGSGSSAPRALNPYAESEARGSTPPQMTWSTSPFHSSSAA